MSDLETAVAPFDVCGPLPTGVTVLEASAGTGKTYTIAALAARYVAEGTPLDQLLLVTFTRMATGELRERVRERLVSAEEGLARALAGAPPGTDDARDAARRRARRRGARSAAERLQRALAGFDARDDRDDARLLPGGARRPGHRRRRRARRRLRRGRPRPARRRRRRPLRPPLPQPRHAGLRPHGGDADRARSPSPTRGAAGAAATRRRTRSRRCASAWPQAVREELERRKRALGVMTYDDLLTRLDERAGRADARGRAAA